MNLPAVKKLVENLSMEQLKESEACLYEGIEPPYKIDGTDEGEKLTHIIAAMWILKDMENRSVKISESLREYTKKVRGSIS